MAHRIIYIILISLIFLIPFNLCAEEEKLLLKRKHWGTVRLTGNLKYVPNYQTGTDADIEFEIETIPYSKEILENKSVKFWWGQDGATPNYIIKDMILFIDKKKILIPSVSYIDLGDIHIPNGVNIYKDGDIIIIKLNGGDGAGSYEAQLFFKNNKIIKRKIFLVEFPDKPPSILNF